MQNQDSQQINNEINTGDLKNKNELQKSDVEILKIVSLIKKSNLFIMELENLLKQGGSQEQIDRWNKTINEEEQKIIKLEADKQVLQGFTKYINEGGTLPEMISESNNTQEITEEEPAVTAHDHDEDAAERIRAKYRNI